MHLKDEKESDRQWRNNELEVLKWGGNRDLCIFKGYLEGGLRARPLGAREDKSEKVSRNEVTNQGLASTEKHLTLSAEERHSRILRKKVARSTLYA